DADLGQPGAGAAVALGDRESRHADLIAQPAPGRPVGTGLRWLAFIGPGLREQPADRVTQVAPLDGQVHGNSRRAGIADRAEAGTERAGDAEEGDEEA